jgi:hypothetical protein
MKIESIAPDRSADLLEQSEITRVDDHGVVTVHHGYHPEHGEIMLVSSIVEPWLMVTAQGSVHSGL